MASDERHPTGGRPDPYQPYRNELLSRDQVSELCQIRIGRVLFDILFCWLCIVAAWAAVWYWTAWWTVLAAAPIIGARYYALFIIGHDGLHRRIAEDVRLNDFINDLFIMAAIGAITRVNRGNHLRHHQHLACDADPDRFKYVCMNKTELSEVLVYLSGIASVFRGIGNVYVGKAGETAPDAAPIVPAKPAYTLRDFVILAVVQGTLIAGLTMVFGWWAYPLLWLAPVYAFTFLGDNFRTFSEHSHPANDRDSDEERLITYLANPVERFFFAPMNMNCHAAHHLWPAIPYYKLPEADRLIRDQPAADGLIWRTSYVGFLLRYCRALPLNECKADGTDAGER